MHTPMKMLDRLIDRAVERYFAQDERIAIRDAVSSYLDRLAPEKFERVAVKAIASEGLNESALRRLIDEAKGDRFIEIFYGNGTHVVISSHEPAGKVGPGW